MVRRHYIMLYYALSHALTTCQHSSDVIESSLKGSVCISIIISLYKSHQFNFNYGSEQHSCCSKKHCQT